jgi:trehalose-6-phosphatase
MHKGTFVTTVLEIMTEAHGAAPDMVVIVGDDLSDENMFSSVLSYMAASGKVQAEEEEEDPFSLAAEAMLDANPGNSESSKKDWRGASNSRIFTCTVGKKPSIAGFYLENVEGVEKLLETLSRGL